MRAGADYKIAKQEETAKCYTAPFIKNALDKRDAFKIPNVTARAVPGRKTLQTAVVLISHTRTRPSVCALCHT